MSVLGFGYRLLALGVLAAAGVFIYWLDLGYPAPTKRGDNTLSVWVAALLVGRFSFQATRSLFESARVADQKSSAAQASKIAAGNAERRREAMEAAHLAHPDHLHSDELFYQFWDKELIAELLDPPEVVVRYQPYASGDPGEIRLYAMERILRHEQSPACEQLREMRREHAAQLRREEEEERFRQRQEEQQVRLDAEARAAALAVEAERASRLAKQIVIDHRASGAGGISRR